ncbi:unnamed protein product, partial [Protopolystoma xenopodis]
KTDGTALLQPVPAGSPVATCTPGTAAVSSSTSSSPRYDCTSTISLGPGLTGYSGSLQTLSACCSPAPVSSTAANSSPSAKLLSLGPLGVGTAASTSPISVVSASNFGASPPITTTSSTSIPQSLLGTSDISSSSPSFSASSPAAAAACQAGSSGPATFVLPLSVVNAAAAALTMPSASGTPVFVNGLTTNGHHISTGHGTPASGGFDECIDLKPDPVDCLARAAAAAAGLSNESASPASSASLALGLPSGATAVVSSADLAALGFTHLTPLASPLSHIAAGSLATTSMTASTPVGTLLLTQGAPVTSGLAGSSMQHHHQSAVSTSSPSFSPLTSNSSTAISSISNTSSFLLPTGILPLGTSPSTTTSSVSSGGTLSSNHNAGLVASTGLLLDAVKPFAAAAGGDPTTEGLVSLIQGSTGTYTTATPATGAGGGGPYGCRECGKEFRILRYLEKHRRIHTGEKPYQCCFCGRQFNDWPNMNRHKRIHTGILTCSIRWLGFLRFFLLDTFF